MTQQKVIKRRAALLVQHLEEALRAESCTSPCVDNYCPVHGIRAQEPRKK